MTEFWLVRHAIVEENARAVLYGTMDVELCPSSLLAQAPMYRALSRRLPHSADWIVTPLSRTKRTAQAIFAAGYPPRPLIVEPALIEQSMGDWQGLTHAALESRLTLPAHPFWPHAAQENQVIARVGAATERLAAANPGGTLVIVSHGGAIRAAVAHALGISAHAALSLSIQNLSLTRLERHPTAWRVGCVNELPGY
jgi:alpha-ribazole phosphatase